MYEQEEIWHFDQPIMTNPKLGDLFDMPVVTPDQYLNLANDTLIPEWARKRSLQDSQMVVIMNGTISSPLLEPLKPVMRMNISMDPVHLTSSQRQRRYETLLIFGKKKIKWTQFGVDYKNNKYPVRSDFAKIRKRQGGRFVKK